MRLLKLKAPVLALILAVAALALSFGLSYVVGLVWHSTSHDQTNPLDRFLGNLYHPAEMLALRCLRGSIDLRTSVGWGLFIVVGCIFILIEWYLIFLAGIGIYRHFSKRGV
jgi:hypothetical protein